MTNQEKIGSKTALLIGLPIGIIFSLFVVVLSLFPPFDIGLELIGGKIFWHPIIWAIIIPFSFGILLWNAGLRIKKYLDKGYSILKTSFYFTLFINTYLFGLILLIFLIGGQIFDISFSTFRFAFGFTALVYMGATLGTTLTIGVLIVHITKRKIYR